MATVKLEVNCKKGRFVISEKGELAGEMTYTRAGKKSLLLTIRAWVGKDSENYR